LPHYARRLTIVSTTRMKSERRVRRSKRVKLSLSVVVHGKTASGESFRELTRTLSLSAHGGLLALAANVQKEQTILVENKTTRKEQECRVAYVGPPQNGKCPVGFEFTGVVLDFWQIHFPPVISN
jgi:hypothetical protein